MTDAGPARIYYIHPLLAGPLSTWPTHLQRAQRMGFTHLCVAPLFTPAPDGDVFLVDDYEASNSALQAGGDADGSVRLLADMCRDAGLELLLDIVLDRVATDGAMARSAPHWFYRTDRTDILDPRQSQLELGAVPARFDNPEREHELRAWWTDRLLRLTQAGAVGFRLLGLAHVPAPFLKSLLSAVRQESGHCRFLGWTPGMPWAQFGALEDVGLDAVFSSTAWWDGRASWFVEEANRLRRIAPQVIGVAEAPFEERLAARLTRAALNVPASYRRALRTAAATAQGMLVPMGFEFGAVRKMDASRGTPDDLEQDRAATGLDLSEEVTAANIFCEKIAALATTGEMRVLTSTDSPVTALLRADKPDVRDAQKAAVILINTGETAHAAPITLAPLPPAAGAAFTEPTMLDGFSAGELLAGGDVCVASVTRSKPIAVRRNTRTLTDSLKGARVAIENVTPSVDGGAFPVKRLVGQPIRVEADVFTDGHDIIGVELAWKAADEKDWRRIPATSLGNDRWSAAFTPTRIGRHVFTVEGWRDDYASLCHEVEVKHDAGVDIALELTEARQFLETVNARAVPCNTTALGNALRTLQEPDAGASVHALSAPSTVKAVAASIERPFRIQHPPITVDVERPQAGFANWYELFPRSQSGDRHRHGTFDDVIGRLADVRDMGFDVLYFPPIHPIGRKNRKGPNNTLTPGPDDPGSPYAIGSEEGGHDAIHPQLGTLADFRRLVAAARANGLEIALDFAVQCSPDHPWLRDHSDWFKWRPDGSIKYAENPPKKYQDIVNVDFYGEDAPGLWTALRDIVLFWASEGVRIFRVDNPHTKPLPLWQWMIADVRARYPDAIFLSEAFTRPKVMYRLAKVGFSQSYTYFTWRNTKQELAEYLTELSTTEVKDFFRPHFFVNTPDINPYFLQTSGRPGFLIRAALAATLSGLWGVYSGFEICEAAPLPGREEYLDSEKYEIRIRDQHAAGNIVAEITALNRIRKAHPALQSHLNVAFYNAFNDQVLLYGKRVPGSTEMILVAVSLDPHNVQSATFELPLWEWKLPDNGSLQVDDLMRGSSTVWTGKLQNVRLDPSDMPFAIWRIAPPGGAP